MPITFAHPATILPIARLRRESGWLGGLVAGSVAPDILQTFAGHMDRLPHSVRGLVLLDAPAAVLLAWLAHKTIGARLRRLPGLESIRPITAFSWKWAAVAALAGGATHLGLDLFTHDESPLARTGFLSMPVGGPNWNPVTVAELLWYVASALGTAALVAWLGWRARLVPGSWRRFLSWPWILLGAAIAGPFLPVVRVMRRMYTPNPVEFIYRVTNLADEVRWSLFLSCALGFAVLHLVTPERPGEDPETT